jgi:cbb3-type cytochrome oxidase maturation protein
MIVMLVIVPVALVVVLAAVLAYLWAARHGQFDDLTTPAIRALHDDPAPPRPPAEAPHDEPRVEPGPEPPAPR